MSDNSRIFKDYSELSTIYSALFVRVFLTSVPENDKINHIYFYFGRD